MVVCLWVVDRSTHEIEESIVLVHMKATDWS